MKYLRPRGSSFQFERSVPLDVRPILGFNSWRESLWTDSKTNAERLCRKRTVETDEIIDAVRSGSYRNLTDDDLHGFAVRWSLDFQLINRQFIPRDMFPDAFESEPRIGDEATNSILSSRTGIETSVLVWLSRTEPEVELLPAEHDALIDLCTDEYLTANPELSNGWKDIIADAGVEDAQRLPDYLKVVKRGKKTLRRRRITSMFEKYADDSDIGTSARNDFGVGIRRFCELHGDLDVAEINRRHIEDFRDMLRRLPSRPPNSIRKLPMPEQVAWAEGLDIITMGQAAINKNIGGVKVTLQYAFDQTSEINNRDWRNPCDGFTKKPKKTRDKIRGFTPDQIGLVFSDKIHRTQSVEKFWIPLVLYFTGARLDEISQLHVGDVYFDPVPHLRCENLFDDDPAIAKKVKSISANRTIPLHHHLIELGFLEYTEAIRSLGHQHLFPNLPHSQAGKRGNSISRAFIRRFREFGKAHIASGLNTKRLVTHSLRHSFRTAGYRGKIDQEFLQVVMGHYVGGVSYETYGDEIYRMPDVLAERVMNEIQLPHIDMEFMKSEADRYLEQLRRAKDN